MCKRDRQCRSRWEEGSQGRGRHRQRKDRIDEERQLEG